MHLLDTNIVNHLRNGNKKVIARYESVSNSCYVSSIVVEEILYIGYMAEITSIRSNRSKSDLTLVQQGMIQALQDLSGFNLLPYTTTAEQAFNTSKDIKRRKMDGRIAAHALELGYILVTENTRHFADIPSLTIEDWTE